MWMSLSAAKPHLDTECLFLAAIVQINKVLVITAVYDRCCNRLLLNWTLLEADHKWNIEEF